MSSENDKTILSLFSSGDEEGAFRMLVSSHKQMLYQHVRRMVGSHAEADDVLQDVLIKAWRGLASYRGEAKISSWLYRIANNQCLTHLQQRQRRATTPLEPHHTPAAHSRTAPSPSEIEQQLAKALDSLPNKQRLVFCMRYYDELKYEEMAKITGTSVGALKSSYHIAVKKIEQKLREGLNL